MKYLLIALTLMSSSCASRGTPSERIVIESRTQPLELEADAGPPFCSVRAMLNGVEVTFVSWAGCYVIRREISLPDYDSREAYKP